MIEAAQHEVFFVRCFSVVAFFQIFISTNHGHVIDNFKVRRRAVGHIVPETGKAFGFLLPNVLNVHRQGSFVLQNPVGLFENLAHVFLPSPLKGRAFPDAIIVVGIGDVLTVRRVHEDQVDVPVF